MRDEERRCEEQVKKEVEALEDPELIQTAWDEVLAFDLRPDLKSVLERDVQDAQDERDEQRVLSMQGRGRVRHVLATVWFDTRCRETA